MNENAKKWIETLETTDFPQGKQSLRSQDGYCCLGIACDLYSKLSPKGLKTDIKEYIDRDDDKEYFTCYYGECKEEAYLPVEVSNWLGMIDYHIFGDPQFKLANLNDNGKSFKEIAEFLKTNEANIFESND